MQLVLPIVVGGLLLSAAVALLDPEFARDVAAKEGTLEHVSHFILAAAVVAWWGAVLAPRTTQRWLTAAIAVMCMVILAEELDWGQVYGVGDIGAWVEDGDGHANLHNAWGGASYLLFALAPIILIGVVGWRRGDQPGRLPRRTDAVGLIVLAVASVGGTLLLPAAEGGIDETGEALLYAGLAWIAIRPRAPERPPSSSQGAGCG
ncbi:MAG: hypothetical protein K0V04_34500 [Deltaproteobacteria bacterium]|nr:hypothetical protein [Deltaproteobacteria bacterium]